MKYNINKHDDEFTKKNNNLYPKVKENHNYDSPFSLECGHTYHKKCIADWMSRKNYCPLCKTKIDVDDDSDEYKPLQENLVEIQRSFYPEISDYIIDYGRNTFSWNNPREVAESRNTDNYYYNDGGYSNESAGAHGEW